jgi:glycosyltransferase involved in cell wall biosynthesis
VVRATDLACLRDPGFWRSLRPDVAVVVTWLGLADVVGALKEACPRVVSIADSDGQVGVRVFPGATFARSVWQHLPLTDRLRAAKFWVQRYLLAPDVFDRPVLESAERADVIALGSAQAKECLTRFFAYYRRPDLAAKLAVVPYPVDACFLRGEVPGVRQRNLVAIGRWDDPQKDAPLLADAVRRVLKAKPDLSFALVGPGGDPVFGPLCDRHPQVRRLGAQPPDAIAALLKASRSLLMSSRWEGAPVVVNEALCMGCTLVGPGRLIGLRSFCQGDAFGTTSPSPTANRLAAAILEEMKAWDDGRRDPQGIAATYRPQFDPRTVCGQLLELPAQ